MKIVKTFSINSTTQLIRFKILKCPLQIPMVFFMHGKFGTKYIGVKKQNTHVARASGSTAKRQPHAEKFMITIHVIRLWDIYNLQSLITREHMSG